MLRRSISVGLLTLAFGTGMEAARAQQTPSTTPSASTPAKTTTHAAKAHKKPKPEPVVEVPPPPPTPEQSPAGTPLVSYDNGQLSIHSENSTLGAILNAVKARTGASIEGPGSTSSDRVATQIGPGNPREVLQTLLTDSKYDFILLGDPGNPASVQKIILTARLSGGTPTEVATSPQNHPPTPTFQPQSPAQPDVDQELPDAEIPDDANQPEQPPPPETEQQPPNGMPGQMDNGQPGNPNQPKSPEQLLQELQRMQQQQQQQQQNPQ